MARKAFAAPAQRQHSGRQQPGTVQQLFTTPGPSIVLLLSGLFLITMMILTVWGDRGLLEMWRRQHEVARLAQEIDTSEQENIKLARNIERLRSDMRYIEKIAREELGLVRNGELVFKFVD